MRKWIGRLWLALWGWKAEGDEPPFDKYVLIAAPHTTNWDLPFTLALAFVFDVRVHWMGKHTLFQAPHGWFLKWLGGVPIERHLRKNVVQQMADRFAGSEEFVLAVPTEGTRSRTEYWKSGFYHIARQAQVPIVMGYLDYARRAGGFGGVLHPTGDLRADMDRVRAFYADKIGKYPERFGPVRLREEEEEEAALEPSPGAPPEPVDPRGGSAAG